MFVWPVLLLCAIGPPHTSLDVVGASDPIPFSEGRDQLFSSSADLLACYRNQKRTSPELPAVIPFERSDLPHKREAPQHPTSTGPTGTKAPLDPTSTESTGTKAPLDPTSTESTGTKAPLDPTSTESTGTKAPLDPTSTESTGTKAPLDPTSTGPTGTKAPLDPTSTESTGTKAPLDPTSTESTGTKAPLDSGSSENGTPPRPVLNRSMHLRVELLLPDFTRSFEVEFHAESSTARTTVENSSTIYRGPAGQGQIQFLKIEIDTTSGAPVRRCTKSPALPASTADNSIPGLPNLEPFKFFGYKTEEGRQVEHWQNVLIGKPGDYGAARGESLNYTHDFFVYREGGDAVPLRYKVTTDSSVLGAASDTYTHRYTLLPPPTAPLTPDVALCDDVQEYQGGRRRRRATLSREEFIWLVNAKKEQVDEHRNNDLKPESEEIVWSY